MKPAHDESYQRNHAPGADTTHERVVTPRPVESEPTQSDDPRPGAPLDPNRVLAILHSRLRVLLAVLSIGIVIAVVGLALLPRTFLSSASLQYTAAPGEDASDRPRALIGGIDAIEHVSFLTTLGSKVGMSAADVSDRLEVTPEMEIGVLRIKGRAGSADRSVKLANLAATELMVHLASLERDALGIEATEIERRISGQMAVLERARSAYDSFREANGIADLATERTQQIDSAANLRSQRDLAQADIEGLEARVAQLRRDLSRTPRMVTASSSTVQSDRGELARLEAEITSARSTYSESHPAVRALELQIAALRTRIASGNGSASTQVVMGMNGQYQLLEGALAAADAELAAARERSSSIHQLATNASQRVSTFSAIEGRATELLSELRTQETLLGELRERRARVDARLLNPDSRFSISAPATRPLTPEAVSKKRFVLAAAPLVLLLLAAFAFVAIDLGGGRMRTPAEIAYWSRLPVIASSDWPRNLRAVDDLVAAMDDWALRSDGTTMLVPLSEREGPLVTTLAERLHDGWTTRDYGRMSGAEMNVSNSGPFTRPVATVIVTPPPSSSGPHAGVRSSGMELVRASREPVAMRVYEEPRRRVLAWEGAEHGQKLRRESRLVDRVVVVVSSGAVTVAELGALRTRLGRGDGVGILVLDLPDVYLSLPDRVGAVGAFWTTQRDDG